MTDRPRLRLRYQLAAITATRLVLNTMYRMVYPFMTVFANGLGVEVSTLARAVALRSAIGLAAPVLSSSADRHGRKRGMLQGLAVFVVGAVVAFAFPRYLPFALALMLTATGKIMFDPSMQAYLGDTIGYRRRGQAIAATEVGWSMAFLLGVPVVGWLIARSGWTAPFPWLAAGGALGFIAIWRLLPPDPPRTQAAPSLASALQLIASHTPAIAGLGVGLLLSAANETINIIFGVWLEISFGVQIAALSAAAAAIGLAELSGEGLVAVASDRIGKRRAVALGVLLNCGACVLLPVLGTQLLGAFVALFLFYVTFEFTLVSSIPLMTELVPGARASMMASNIASLSAGRALGALAGAAIFSFGLSANTTAAVVLNLAALGLLLALVRD